ncbi:MAG: hypothetical protein LWY06_01975 [Firmicutes bacterium]|nr:hypothetical protein [Bacillota bacterium]
MRKFGKMPVLFAGFIIVLFFLILAAPPSEAQVNQPFQNDTSRFLPNPNNFQQNGWQVSFEKLNQEDRNFNSVSVRGYRMLIDLESSPKTALAFNITVSLMRPGNVIDEKRGMEVSNAHLIYQQFFDSCAFDHAIPAKQSVYGDESFEAAKDFDKYRIVIRRGQYLIDIAGTDLMPDRQDKPSLLQVAHYFAYFSDARIFGARISLLRPMQAFDDSTVPMVAGKKIVVYGAVEVEKNVPFPSNYQFAMMLEGNCTRQKVYSLLLGEKGKTVFGPAGDTDDGSIWREEYAEPVPLTPELRNILSIPENPGYSTYLYRFFIDPALTEVYDNYVFRVNLFDPNGSKLRELALVIPAVSSARLRVAVLPLPVGFWAPGKDWKLEEPGWINKIGDQGWKMDSYLNFMSNLPEEAKAGFMRKPVADLLRKQLPKSHGKIKYLENTTKARYFLYGIMPLAEEKLEFDVLEEFPEDLTVDPNTDDIAKITQSLNAWMEKHPKYDRVIAVVPGNNPAKGGVSFNMDNDAGIQFWYRKKAAIVSVDATPKQFARALAQTFGAIDENLPVDAKAPTEDLLGKPINKPLGAENGDIITNGFWAAKNQFMGTSVKPVNSIMGLKEPAWIPKSVYKGIIRELIPQ